MLPGPCGAPEVSRKRGAEPGLLPRHVSERKRACWGILTSQGGRIDVFWLEAHCWRGDFSK